MAQTAQNARLLDSSPFTIPLKMSLTCVRPIILTLSSPGSLPTQCPTTRIGHLTTCGTTAVRHVCDTLRRSPLMSWLTSEPTLSPILQPEIPLRPSPPIVPSPPAAAPPLVLPSDFLTAVHSEIHRRYLALKQLALSHPGGAYTSIYQARLLHDFITVELKLNYSSKSTVTRRYAGQDVTITVNDVYMWVGTTSTTVAPHRTLLNHINKMLPLLRSDSAFVPFLTPAEVHTADMCRILAQGNLHSPLPQLDAVLAEENNYSSAEQAVVQISFKSIKELVHVLQAKLAALKQSSGGALIE